MHLEHLVNLTLCIGMFITLYACINKSKYPIHAPSNIFLVFYWIVVPGGAVLAWIYEILIGEFKATSSEIFATMLIAWIGLFFYYIGIWSGNVIYGKITFQIFPRTSLNTKRLIAIFMLIISISAMITYISSSSFLEISNGNQYTQRFSENLGKGYLTLFFYYYIPAALLLFIINPTRKCWIILFTLVTLTGLFSFSAIGGARRGLFIGIVTMLIAAHISGIIRLTFPKVIIGGVAMIAALTILASLRYGNDLSDFNDIEYHTLAHWIIDSISPIDSLANSNRFVLETNSLQGLDLFINQFQAVIPRSIWPEKPQLILNSGNFYTQQVLGYPVDGLTISPTLLGSLILAGGWIGVAAGMAITGFILNWLSLLLIKSNDKLVLVFLISNTISFFGLAREGLEVLVYKLIIDYIIFLIFLIISLFINQLIKKSNRSPSVNFQNLIHHSKN